MNVHLLLLTLAFFSERFVVQVHSKFSVNSFKLCDSNADYPISINSTFRTVNGLQYMNSTANFKIPLDNTLQLNVTAEEVFGKNHYVYLLDIHETRGCDAMHKYLGEFIYEIERHIGLIPKMCPIPQRQYSVHNMALHFENIATLQAFPFGKLRTKTRLRDVKNKVVACFETEEENRL